MDYQAIDALRVANQVAQAKHDATQDLILALTADGQLSPQQVRAAQAACKPFKVAADNAHKAYMSAVAEQTEEIESKLPMSALRLAAEKRISVRRLLLQNFDKPALSALV